MERAAFDSAAERHARKVYTFAAYLLGDPHEAEDVAQEVLVKLWTRGGGIPTDRLEAWLMRVTRNACTDCLRKRKRTAEVISIQRDDRPRADRPSPEPSPERMAAGSELGARILGEMERLSTAARSVVILREIQGFSYVEIAEIMNMSLDTVRVTLHRARRRLRESLKEVRSHVALG